MAVGSGDAALALIPELARALDGGGALLPVPADDDRQAALLTETLRAGEPVSFYVGPVLDGSVPPPLKA